MADRQKRGEPVIARALFGATGTGYTYHTKYESRSELVRTPVDHHTDTYVDGRHVHRHTDRTSELSYESRMTPVGVNTLDHTTIELDFEYVENASMTIRAPWWAQRGDLTYVACHRGVGSNVWEVYSPEHRKWHVVHKDVMSAMRYERPILAAVAIYVVQVFVLHLGFSEKPALAVAAGWFAGMLLSRMWRAVMLKRSHDRAERLITKLIATDDADEIRDAIRQRVRGW